MKQVAKNINNQSISLVQDPVQQAQFQNEKSHALKLFQFLKKFNQLKTKPQLNVDSYEKVLWFHDIPKQKECYSITHKLEVEAIKSNKSNNLDFNKWVEIKKPKRTLCPKPPSIIKAWLKNYTPKDYIQLPQLFSYINSSTSNIKNEVQQDTKILLENCPQVKKAFEDYLNQKWIPWAREEKQLQSVIKIYNNLYNIYNKNKYQGESYKIELGLGFLCAKNPKGKEVRRHIVTAPAVIDFHSVTGTIVVGPGDQSVELSLEMNMFTESEKPRNCDDINSQLSDLGNDFWTEKAFKDCLTSWLNNYDPNAQLTNDFNKDSVRNFSTLNIFCPAIILKKRNEKAFLKFYDSIIQNIEDLDTLQSSFLNILKTKVNSTKNYNKVHDSVKKVCLAGKHYFPLPANEEQKKIIDKILHNNQVVVQGPPGTGKTHSIANLICHFLAEGKKILVTSQTDRALRVLKNKLPDEVQSLCVEILGRDQKSFQELKNSFEIINSRYQNFDKEKLKNKIKKLEDKDDELAQELEATKDQLIKIKNSETVKYENLFNHYQGTLANIAHCLKNEENKYQWIKKYFNVQEYGDACPISNQEAVSLFKLINQLKGMDDSIFEESIDFVNQIFTPKQFEEKTVVEQAKEKLINTYQNPQIQQKASLYENIKASALKTLKQATDTMCPKIETLLNRNEAWVSQCLKECLADKDRQWKSLYDESSKILDTHRNIFISLGKMGTIMIDHSISHEKLNNLLRDFFKKYKSSDSISWGVFCSSIVRKLKAIKINGRSVSSYKDVEQLRSFVIAKDSLDRVGSFWIEQDLKNLIASYFKNQYSTINNYRCFNGHHFSKWYHVFKDLCEPLEDCLAVHKSLTYIKPILASNNIFQPQWTVDSIKQESNVVNYVIASKELYNIQHDFKKLVAVLAPYKDQKNNIAQKLIIAIKGRDLVEYKKSINDIDTFQVRKKQFTELCQIKKKLKNNAFYFTLKKEFDGFQWVERLKSFERAWDWLQANFWFVKQMSEQFYQQLDQKRQELIIKKKHNMEQLVSHKAWDFCLSHITEYELSHLRAFVQSIAKIGKGTGKSASRHRKVAQKRMKECKAFIPAWIMPLYRVVENIQTHSQPFDIAIIDEASQTGPDGFLINYIAKKVIVVGDKEQISPENLGVKEDDVEHLKNRLLKDNIKYYEHIGRDYSYYDYCEILFTRSHIQLREHFRCMPEIIQFSNQISYSGVPLIPLRQYGSSRLEPLKSAFVTPAISKVGSGKYPQNEKEAQAIIDQIKLCIKDPAYKNKTFGIISLQGQAQVKCIEQALSKIDNKEIENRAIQVGNAYAFQGDERDVIFLSMAVAKDWKLSALTRETYKRQYNVATSRARDQMWLFHSIDINDVRNSDCFRRKLLDHFKEKAKKSGGFWTDAQIQDLYQKIKETKNKHHDNAPKPFDSWFEARVFHTIAVLGYQVIPQYKTAGRSIDMVVIGSQGRLAVECDGDYWHDSSQKGADQQRQWQLERCGWTFWRLRQSAFHRDPELALKNLWHTLDKMNIKPFSKIKGASHE